METLEEMYKGKFSEYENVCAARGCNQHKHVPGCDEAEDNTWSKRGHNYREYRHDIEEVMYKTFYQLARNGYVDGVYFDGESFYTDNQDGKAELVYTSADIDDFLEENDMQESTVDEQTKLFMQNRGMEIFEAIDWDDFE